jgi:AAA domain
VLYLNGEDSSTEIRRRLWAFCQQHKVAEQDLVRLYVAGADAARVQSLSFLCVNDKGATTLNEAGFTILESALQSLCPDLLVLDPLVVFCGGGNMNDNSVMSLVMRKLKALAVKYDCAILIVHHTRKGRTGSDATGEAEAISGAAAIVNLARRAIMPVTMTDAEAKQFTAVLPSQRLQYFKLADAKSNLAPLSVEAPWYELASEELPNPEPPIYPNGDRVQAVKRTYLTRSKPASLVGPQELAIRFELMKLIDRGLTIDGEKVPYSPNSTGNNKKRAILDDAMAAVRQATENREWLPGDLRATAERELEALKHDGWVVVEKIEKGRFRRSYGLRPVWERTRWAKERENLHQHGGPTVRTPEEQQDLERSDLKKSLEELVRPNGQSVNGPLKGH